MLLAEQKKNPHHAACPILAWMTGKPEVDFPIADQLSGEKPLPAYQDFTGSQGQTPAAIYCLLAIFLPVLLIRGRSRLKTGQSQPLLQCFG
jgi:hypothetical protein